jgi:YidC/Oxa1 family membrane protein insertase
MEQARLIIAIALSLLVFLLWEQIFKPETPPKKTQQSDTTTQTTKNSDASTAVVEAPLPEKTPPSKESSTPLPPVRALTEEQDSKGRVFTVENSLYIAKLSEEGGEIISFKLKKYRETIQPDAPLLDLIDQEKRDFNLKTEITNSNIPESAVLRFHSKQTGDKVHVAEQAQKIELISVLKENLAIIKTYSFFPDEYRIDHDLQIINNTDTELKGDIAIVLKKAIKEKSGQYGFEGPSLYIDKKLQQIKAKKIEEQSSFSGDLSWSALQNRYFIKAILPRGESRNKSVKLSLIDDTFIENRTIEKEQVFRPNNTQAYQYQVYFGPMRGNVLKKQGHNLEKAINFGWFDFIAKPCVWFMNFFYTHIISNYGIAIIVLTIIAKIILWPLGNKSYKSMNAMKKLQPMMAEIREKHKNDKKKMNEELMGLYKLYKINPMGGCLPMVLQIPVFFALYRMLYSAIELRHAPFFGWINDLSAPDRLFNFNFAIPFMQKPYGIPVLTVIMGATMILQQKMTPQAGDPTQAKMMMLMPVVFTFIFINFPSGLVLYWLVNNILSIGQQQFVAKKYS